MGIQTVIRVLFLFSLATSIPINLESDGGAVEETKVVEIEKGETTDVQETEIEEKEEIAEEKEEIAEEKEEIAEEKEEKIEEEEKEKIEEEMEEVAETK